MRTLLVSIFGLFGILLTGVGMNQAVSADIFPYDYEVRTLDNGLKYFVIPMESPGLVSYFSVVRTGSRDEYEPGHSGFAHLFEHMMFRGTKNFPGEVYDRMVTQIGADGNAYTTDDYTLYYMTFSASDLEKVVHLESDRFQNLEYSEAEFQTETGAVYGEYRKGRTNPWSVLYEEIYDMAYDEHTYQHTTIGFEEDIKAMPTMYDYSLSFFNRYYKPENVVLMVVGDVSPEQVSPLVKTYYGEWESGYEKPKIKDEPPQQEPRSTEVDYSGRTLPIIDIAYKGPAFPENVKEMAAISLFGEMAFGENSTLYKQLVLQEQKVQFVAPSFDNNRDPGLLHIFSMVKDEEDVEYVREQILATVNTYRETFVDESELTELKSRQKYQFLLDLDTPSNVAHNLARFVALTGGVQIVNEYYSALERVTPRDILEVVNTYFVETNRNELVLKGAQQ
ncbi:MAG: insulinase family protein [Candidatus Marinimicrobia bacterium]|nr:insulinase family protein [Candidatus Neomarinimicrobiota bacterium]MCF7880261.1 insulinase family protein [Candidatus Neomarinimicrobiota bacterium]